MNKNLFFLISFFFLNLNSTESAVTYTFSGGRFGDNIISYLHAKWVSYKYKIPLLYKPFLYSDQLVLHQKEKVYDPNNLSQYKAIIEFRAGSRLNIQKDVGCLYIIPYFPESIEEHKKPEIGIHKCNFHRDKWFYFSVDWNDHDFIKEIQELLKPINNLNLIYPPKDCVSVALHVRRSNNSFDNALLCDSLKDSYDPNIIYYDVVYPLKFACNQYFIEQLKYIINYFKEKKIYVYIFTDDPNPGQIADEFKNEINNDQVIFDYRKENNNHNANILEDYFSILNFDCFVRSDSNFALTISKIGKFKVLIYPEHHIWKGFKLNIDRVRRIIN